MSGGATPPGGTDINIVISIGLIVFFVLLNFYVIGGAYLEKIHSPVGHETSIALIMGFIVSLTLWKVNGAEAFASFVSFNGPVFFYLCLPPIIFAAGYNMRRKKFFSNIGYIILFGLFGTIITFIVFSILTWAVSLTGIMTYVVPMTNE